MFKTLADVSDRKIFILAITFAIVVITIGTTIGSCGPGIVRAWRNPPGWVEPPAPPEPCVDMQANNGSCNSRIQCEHPQHVLTKERLDDKEVWVCRCPHTGPGPDASVEVSP